MTGTIVREDQFEVVGNEVSRITLYVWNAGTQPITRADLRTSAPLRYEVVNGRDVLQASVIAQTRAANNVALTGCEIDFDYLNSGDGLSIDIYVTDGDQPQTASSGASVQIKGEIIGATKSPAFEMYEFSVARKPWFALFGVGIAVGLFLAFKWPDTWNSLEANKLYSWLDFGAGVLATIGVGTLIVFSIRVLLASERIPLSLISATKNPP